MLAVALMMLAVLVVAGLVVVYVAYPHRGEELPAVPWLGDAMTRAADRAPLLEVEYAEEPDAERSA